MKKNLLIIPAFIIFCALLLLSCEKKKDSGISPGFKEDTGTGGNPFPNNPTVTGTPTSSNPATQNSVISVGGQGWSNPTCASTNSVNIQGINGSVNVTISFLTAPTTGTYAVSSSLTPSQCVVTVVYAPNQPSGTMWYGKSGLVSVNTTTASIQASFSGVVCTQATFNFPTVTLNGNVACN